MEGVIMFTSTKKWIHDFLYGVEVKSVGYWNKSKTPILVKLVVLYVCLFIFVIGYALVMPNEDIETIQGDGKIIPGRRFSQIQSEYDGKLVKVLVQEGQFVQEGDFLMEISRRNERGNDVIYKPKAIFSGTVYNVPVKDVNGSVKMKDALVEIIPRDIPLFAEVWFDEDDVILLKADMPVRVKVGLPGHDKTESYKGNIIKVDSKSVFNKKKNSTERKVLVSIEDDLETPRNMGFRINPGMEATVGKEFKRKNWTYSVLEPFFIVKNWVS